MAFFRISYVHSLSSITSDKIQTCFESFKKLHFNLFFSIFDKDDDGYIPVHEMREILQSLGDKMTDKELDEMMKAASSDREGFINYDGRYI